MFRLVSTLPLRIGALFLDISALLLRIGTLFLGISALFLGVGALFLGDRRFRTTQNPSAGCIVEPQPLAFNPLKSPLPNADSMANFIKPDSGFGEIKRDILRAFEPKPLKVVGIAIEDNVVRHPQGF